MKIPLTYGFFSALGGAVLTLLLYFTGFHDSVEKMKTAQWVGGILGCAILVTCIALAMRDKRAKAPVDAEWGYGSALGVGTLMVLWSTLFSAIFLYAYSAYINTNFCDLLFQLQMAKMEEKGMSANQIAAAEGMMRKTMTPVFVTLFQTIFGFVFSFLIALIVAIFFRKPRTGAFVGDGAPPLVN